MLSRGDTLTILCSLCFCFHILCVDHFVSSTDAIKLSFIQLLTTGVLSGIVMFLFRAPHLERHPGRSPAILYAGILSCGVAYTLQVVGQQYAAPTVATLLQSLESVFSILGGILLLSQVPTSREFFGLRPHLRRSAHLPAAHFGGKTENGILIEKKLCESDSHSFLFIYRAITGFRSVTLSAFSFWSGRCR